MPAWMSPRAARVRSGGFGSTAAGQCSGLGCTLRLPARVPTAPRDRHDPHVREEGMPRSALPVAGQASRAPSAGSWEGLPSPPGDL